MKKRMSMSSIKANATKKGYTAKLRTNGKTLRIFGCQHCRKNTAVKFEKEGSYVLACPCGWRKLG